MKKPLNEYTVFEWLSWAGAILVAGLSVSAFAYREFQTKDDALQQKGDVVQRLDRIENKLDRVLRE